MTTDFRFQNHGSLCLLDPLTPTARQWVEDHLPGDALTWCGAVVIEPRYAGPILAAIEAEGFVVGGGIPTTFH